MLMPLLLVLQTPSFMVQQTELHGKPVFSYSGGIQFAVLQGLAAFERSRTDSASGTFTHYQAKSHCDACPQLRP